LAILSSKSVLSTKKKLLLNILILQDVNQAEMPDALLTGKRAVNHDGVVLTCNKAYYFFKENYIAFEMHNCSR
jgi:hypothetical protein